MQRFLQECFLALLLVNSFISTSSEELKCTVRDCHSCFPRTTSPKEIFCEGTREFSLKNSSQTVFESSGAYSVDGVGNPVEICKLVIRKINVGREFKLNLTGFANIDSLLIENSVIKVG